MSNNYFKHGSYNAICDVCGKKFKADQLKLRWDGFMVCNSDYEVRHPQDLIRVYERPDVLPYTRDEVVDTFVNETAPSIFVTEAICDMGVADYAVCDLIVPGYTDDTVLCPIGARSNISDVAIAGCTIAGGPL